MFQVTGFIAALLAVEYIVLSLGVVAVRRSARIPVGEGSPVNTLLRKRIRVRIGRISQIARNFGSKAGT